MKTRPGSACTISLLAVIAGGYPEAGSGQPVGNRLALSATVASDYFAYGLAQTYADASWRLAADYTHDSGFFAGGFIANVDYESDSYFKRPRDLQIDYYAGYQRSKDDWMASVAISRYRYPDLALSYDYTLLSASAVYRDRYFLTTRYSDQWLGIGGTGYGFELGVTQPLDWDIEFGASIGRLKVDPFLGGSFTYWDAGLSRVVDRFALDLRYHDTTLDRSTLLGAAQGDRWAFSVTYAILPR